MFPSGSMPVLDRMRNAAIVGLAVILLIPHFSFAHVAKTFFGFGTAVSCEGQLCNDYDVVGRLIYRDPDPYSDNQIALCDRSNITSANLSGCVEGAELHLMLPRELLVSGDQNELMTSATNLKIVEDGASLSVLLDSTECDFFDPQLPPDPGTCAGYRWIIKGTGEFFVDSGHGEAWDGRIRWISEPPIALLFAVALLGLRSPKFAVWRALRKKRGPGVRGR